MAITQKNINTARFKIKKGQLFQADPLILKVSVKKLLEFQI